MHEHEKIRVACITAGLYFDPAHLQNVARFTAVSQGTSGDVFCVVYDRAHKDARIASYQVKALVLPSWLGGYGVIRGSLRALLYSFFVLRSLMRGEYDVLVAVEPFKSGLLALIGSKLLRVPYAIELNGNYAVSVTGVKGWLVRRIIPHVVKRAGAVKLLYEDQLSGFALRPDKRTFVFHNLVQLDAFKPIESAQKYVLLLGHPWKLKGADIVIDAFRRIADRFPDHHLRIVGYCPEPAPFQYLAQGHPRISLEPAGIPHSEAVKLINGCAVFVLASRTEGMGRVLLEAMAAGKPVIGARVDGIPRVIHHERNGLLFRREDPYDLSTQLSRVLADEAFAGELARNAYDDVHTRLSPAAYTQEYMRFLRYAVGENNAGL